MAAKALKVPLEARAIMLAPLSLITWGALILVGMMLSGILDIDIEAHSGRWFMPADLAASGLLAGVMAGWTIVRFAAMQAKPAGTKWLYFLAASPFGVGLIMRLEALGDPDGFPFFVFLGPFAGVAAGIALHRRFRK